MGSFGQNMIIACFLLWLYISQQKQFAALWGEKVVNKCVSNGPCPSSSSSKQSILFFGVSFFTPKKNYSVSAKSLSSLTIRLMWTKSRKSEGRVSYLSCTASLMGFLNFTLCHVALIIWIVGVRQNQSQFDPENCLCHKIVSVVTVFERHLKYLISIFVPKWM